MTTRGVLVPLFVSVAALGTSVATATPTPREVIVTTTRVSVSDVVPGTNAAVGVIDLGPSPAAGAARLVTRADLLAALSSRQLPVPANIPDSVRVVRKVRHLPPAEMGALVREAVAAKGLARGVALTAVRPDRSNDVADGWTRVEVDVPRAPKKAGPFLTMAIASFFAAGDEVIARVPVPIELAVSAEGTTFDAPRGAAVTLVVRRTFIEVRVSAVMGADADVGDAAPIQLRPSGRVVRARLTSRDEALALDDGR